MLGLESSGKTSLVYRLKSAHGTDEIIKSTGYNVESFKSSEVPEMGIDFSIWDIAGSDISLWSQHLDGIHALIYVVDMNDTGNYQRSKEELDKILPKIPETVPLLIFGNKHDLCFDSNQIIPLTNSLGLSNL